MQRFFGGNQDFQIWRFVALLRSLWSWFYLASTASTRGVELLPAYAQNFLPRSLTSRPLKGDTPTIDLVLGYRKSNESPILKLFLSRLDELVARASTKKTQ